MVFTSQETLVVRGFEVEDPERLVRVVGGTRADLAAWRSAVGGEPLCGLVAALRGEPVGVALGAVGRAAYSVLEIRTAEDHADAAVAALLGHLRVRLPGLALEVRTAEAAIERALARNGLAAIRDEVGYGRALEAPLAPEPSPFTLRSYEEAGKAALVAALAEVASDDPFFGRRGMDALDALEEMIENATCGGVLDSSLWYLVEVDGRVAGVMLGQRRVGQRRAETREGSFAYIGLTRELRGKGLGSALHAAGLDLLAAAGATEYRDATALDNGAMQRVFERNGCTRLGSTRVWRLDTEPLPARFDSLANVRAWLQADGHAVEAHDDVPWIDVHWRSGYNRRLLEIGWSADAHVTQVMHRFDFRVPDQAAAPLARLICEVNDTLNLPGFFFDRSTMLAGFRHAILQDRDGSIAARQLLTAYALVVNTAEAYEDDLARLCARHDRPPLLHRIPIDARVQTARGRRSEMARSSSDGLSRR
jgi:ribosomal protein S18 acetylase RimI-like enzyme